MKKTVIGLAAMVLATGAYAQSSVTLYGRIDNGVAYRTGLPNGNQFGTESGGWGESWWGMIGSEDLGDGLKAIFQLESGINTNTGGLNNGGLFGRHATIGLSSNTYGTFKLGNIGAGFLTQDSWDLDPQEMQAYNIATLDRGRVWDQAGNGFEYTSPGFGGLTLKGQYALTNAPGNWNGTGGGSGTDPSNLGTPQGRVDGVKAMYNASNLELLGIYDEVRDRNGQFTNVYATSREALMGGTYTWGPLKAYVGYQHLSAPQATLQNQGLTATAVTGTLPGGITGAPTAVDHEWLGVNYTVSPFVTLTGGVYHANANNGNGNATLYTLGGTYNLSKRTFLYTELGYVKNSSTSNVGLGNGYSDYYGPNTNEGGTSEAPDYGKSQFGMITGIMHQF
jgi:predicted porin